MARTRSWHHRSDHRTLARTRRIAGRNRRTTHALPPAELGAGQDIRPVEKRPMSSVDGRIARQLTACGLVVAGLSGLPRPAGAVEEETVGWWIYAGSIR